jgi:peptidyl-prolyl cis-trans isomerase B (cyclophilin B)
MSNRTLGFTIAFVVLAAIAIGGGIYLYNNSNSQQPMTEENNTTPTQNNQQSQTATQSGPETLNGCTRNFDANKLATAQVDTAGKYVTLKVKGFGDIKVQLYDKDAPKTVENFLRLVNAGYYDCLTFHRVAKGFVIQGGDPTGTGSGGDSAFGGI